MIFKAICKWLYPIQLAAESRQDNIYEDSVQKLFVP